MMRPVENDSSFGTAQDILNVLSNPPQRLIEVTLEALPSEWENATEDDDSIRRLLKAVQGYFQV